MAQLHEATTAEDVTAALAAGEDIERRADCRTPLLNALWRGRFQAARALIAAGANVKAKSESEYYNTALHYACCHDSVELVDILIARGADVNARDGLGATPLFDAHSVGATTMLCDAGADTEARDSNGRTVLCRTLLRGEWTKALVLIDRGANGSDPWLLFDVLAAC